MFKGVAHGIREKLGGHKNGRRQHNGNQQHHFHIHADKRQQRAGRTLCARQQASAGAALTAGQSLEEIDRQKQGPHRV